MTNPKIPVSTWTMHNCDKSHRDAKSFIKCCLNKYYYNGENAHKPSIRSYGSGSWAVIREMWSDVYYTEHNGKRNNQQYKIFEITTYTTYEEATNYYSKLAAGCWDCDNCRGGYCLNLQSSIVKVTI
jgi:hypothetical protein